MNSEHIEKIYFYYDPWPEPGRAALRAVEVLRATPTLLFVRSCAVTGCRTQITRTSANYSAKQCLERKIAWMKSEVYKRTEALQLAEAELVHARQLLEATK